MTFQLNEWIDRKRVGASLLVILIISLSGLTYGQVTGVVNRILVERKTVLTTMRNHSELLLAHSMLLSQAQMHRAEFEKLNDIVGKLFRAFLRVQGRAWVMPGGDEVYALVNVDHPKAIELQDIDFLLVTNRSRNGGNDGAIDNTKFEVPVIAVFGRTDPPDYVIRLSRAAGERLNMHRPEKFYSVLVEPGR